MTPKVNPMNRRQYLIFGPDAACSGAWSQAPLYPERSIHIIVPFSTGGSSDNLPR
jgi:tripartite-type tricarboxylate transporter receptor subunit TctC